MEPVLTSARFLVSTAVCCGLAVAFALWAVGDAGGGVHALAGLIGLIASLAVMLLIAAAVSDGTAPPVAEAPTVEVEPPAAPPAPPRVPGGRDVLAQRLDEGRGLRAELRPGATDPRVDSWIEEVRAAIEGSRPGVAGYFNALGQRAFADDALRLDAYTRRLATIVRDY